MFLLRPVLWLVVLTSPALAQTARDSTFDVLAIPHRDGVRCTQESPGVGAVASYQFEIGNDMAGDWRSITVDYDSAGTPVSLQALAASRRASTGTATEMIMAMFRGGAIVWGFHSHRDERVAAAGTAMDSAKAVRQLTDGQKEAGVALTRWLWGKRCEGR